MYALMGSHEDDEALVRAHKAYAEQHGALDSGGVTTESLQEEAFDLLKAQNVQKTFDPRQWLRRRARAIATLIRESEKIGMNKENKEKFARLVRGYVVIDVLVGRGMPPTWEWLDRKIKSVSWRKLAEKNRESSCSRQEQQMKSSFDRKAISPDSFYQAVPPSLGFPICQREGCTNQTGEPFGGKFGKTKFIVENASNGMKLQVCRQCVINANSRLDDPKPIAHLNRKDSLHIKLREDDFSIFSDLAIKGKSVASKSETNAKGACKSAKNKKQKTILETVRPEGASGEIGSANGVTNKNKHEGTDADPILLSSSDDEEDRRRNKSLMAVVNPYQRQTRRASKNDVETDPVLDKLKCFMPPEGGRGSIKFALRDYFKLRPMEFLNDSCIDYFLKSIELRLKDELPEAWERCYFFNSFFYKKLTDNQSVLISEETKALAEMPLGDMDDASLQALRCYDLTKSWTKNVDLFDKDYLFIPICEHLHWSLLIVCHPGRGVIKESSDPKTPGTFMIHLDSLRSHRAHDMGKLVKMYLQNEWKAKLRQDGDSAAKRWMAEHPDEKRDFLRMTVRRPHVPLQDNHFDCGLFLCAFVDHFLAYLPKTMSEAKVPRKTPRNGKCKSLAQNRRFFPRAPLFLTHKWFPTGNVGNLRTDMAMRVIKAMAVNAGVMDDHAKWQTDKELTQEQHHMMTYLLNEEEMLKERKECYIGPEWLEVRTDEEEEYGSPEQMSDDVVLTIDAVTSCDAKNTDADGEKGVDSSTKLKTAVDSTRMGKTNGNGRPGGILLDHIEDPGDSKTPTAASALIKVIHKNHADRGTPDLQVISHKRKDGSHEVVDDMTPKFSRRKKRSSNPFVVSNQLASIISSETRGGKLVNDIKRNARRQL